MGNTNQTNINSGFKKEDVAGVMEKVAHWQIDSDYGPWPVNYWVIGSMFVGMTEYARFSNDEYLLDKIKEHCRSVNWEMGENVYHADYQIIGQTYLMLYDIDKDPVMLQSVKERCDDVLANRSLSHPSAIDQTRWDWCDALFMGPPVWAQLSKVTGDPRYLEFMNEEYTLSKYFLFDEEEFLFFRDAGYFKKKEANGEKVFWSRGNGWVFAGLCRILEYMPTDYPNRMFYEELYRKMAYRLVELLPEDCMWHASLLDPASFPCVEASGTGFYLYGLAWGINHGLLNPEEFMPVVQRVWPALVHCVHADGKLGFVQEIGADPRNVDADDTGLYGVGAFLLAGLEIYNMSE